MSDEEDNNISFEIEEIDAVSPLESEATPTQSKTPTGILDADDELLGPSEKDREVSSEPQTEEPQWNGFFNESIEEPQTEASFAEASQIGALAAGENEDIGGSTATQSQHEFSKGDVNKSSDPTNKSIKEPQIEHDFIKVISIPVEIAIFDVASKEQEYGLNESTEISLDDLKLISVERFGNSIAPKVFVEMSAQAELAFVAASSIVRQRVQDMKLVFDPGIVDLCTAISRIVRTSVGTELKPGQIGSMLAIVGVHAPELEMFDSIDIEDNTWGLVAIDIEISGRLDHQRRSRIAISYDLGNLDGMILTFDPWGKLFVFRTLLPDSVQS